MTTLPFGEVQRIFIARTPSPCSTRLGKGATAKTAFAKNHRANRWPDEATPLTLPFNANATGAAVQALLRSVQFQVIGPITANSTRTVRFTLQDGDGGTSATSSETLDVLNL